MNVFYQNLAHRNQDFAGRINRFISVFKDIPTLIKELYIAAIVDAHPRIQATSAIKHLNENKIRNCLVKDFQEINPIISEYFQNKLITLASENQAYTTNYEQRTDIEIHSNGHQHSFVIECKKLTAAESRYVHGRTVKGVYEHDGLEKFIDMTYAATDDEGAMLSFILGGIPEAIVATLNQNVQAFSPSPTSILLSTQLCLDWKLSFQSSHIRSNGQAFRIYHLFYDLT